MSDYQLIAPGTYAAVCRNIQFALAGKEENGQVVIGFELSPIEGDDPTNPAGGRMLSYFGMFTELKPGNKTSAYDITMGALRNIGWTGDDLSELPDLAAAGHLANTVWLVVEHEEWEETTREKIKWVNRPGGGGMKPKKPMDASQLKVFAAAMKSKIRGSNAAATPTKPTQQPPRNGGQTQSRHPNAPGNDDILFATADFADDVSPIARLLR